MSLKGEASRCGSWESIRSGSASTYVPLITGSERRDTRPGLCRWLFLSIRTQVVNHTRIHTHMNPQTGTQKDTTDFALLLWLCLLKAAQTDRGESQPRDMTRRALKWTHTNTDCIDVQWCVTSSHSEVRGNKLQLLAYCTYCTTSYFDIRTQCLYSLHHLRIFLYSRISWRSFCLNQLENS